MLRWNEYSQPLVLGLFPAISSESLGGVQACGRIAWQAVEPWAAARGARADLFCYDPSGARSRQTLPERPPNTKWNALTRALLYPDRPKLLLVWHLSLLRLVPLFRAPRARVAVFLHGIEAWHPYDLLTLRLLRRACLVMSNSAFTRQRFCSTLALAPDKNHTVVHLGIGSALRTPIPTSDPPAALILGRMSRAEDYKGHRELIGVWRRVQQNIPQAQLWIAGDGDLRPDLEHLVEEKGLRDAVRFYGEVTEAAKQLLVQQSRCLVMPSRGEGFGLVYLEAMRMGRPCLVSDCDAGREVVNPPEAGLAVNPGDPEALANAICRLLTPGPEWDAWSLHARRRYEENFTAAHFQQRLIAALEPLL